MAVLKSRKNTAKKDKWILLYNLKLNKKNTKFENTDRLEIERIKKKIKQEKKDRDIFIKYNLKQAELDPFKAQYYHDLNEKVLKETTPKTPKVSNSKINRFAKPLFFLKLYLFSPKRGGVTKQSAYLIFYFDISNILVLIWSYMLIYNIALYLIFSTLFQFVNSSYKTIYSFLDLGSFNFFTKVLIICLFSMAGVPPFWGFFSKIFIFTLLCNSNFFILFPFFFILLFISLYFYIQNIRFLNTTSGSNFTPITDLNLRCVPSYYYLTWFLSFFLIFGVFFTEDLFILMEWVTLC